MNWSKAREATFYRGRWSGGVAWYPYQLTFGVSLRYWPCLHSPSIRVHVLMFKLWLAVRFGSPASKEERS